MIRLMEIKEITEVMELWLKINQEVHSFIPKEYWLEKYDEVQGMMENSNIYVAVENDEILGFAGITEGYYLAGLFVRPKARSKSIGKQLCDHLKSIYDELTLDVYTENVRAISFYERESFVSVESYHDEETDQPSITMVWPQDI